MKKLLIALGAIVCLLVAAVVIIPLVVDVDKYRPQIVSAANDKLNGKLELGKLSLSLWGQIRVEVDGMRLLDPEGKEVVGVKDVYFHVPFSSVLSGSPLLTLKMQNPSVHLIKERNGKLNATSILKASPPGAPSAATPSQPSSSKPTEIPGMAAHARFGMELHNALLTYKDEISGSSSQIENLNFILKDASLSHPTELEMDANLNTAMNQVDKNGQATHLSVKGPVKVSGEATPQVSGGQFRSLKLSLKADADGLEISMPGVFEKTSSVPMNATLEADASQKQVVLEKLDATFLNARIHANATVANIDVPGSENVDFKMSSNIIDLNRWVEVLPALKGYDLGGTAQLSADAQGETRKLAYHALAKVENLTAKAPNLKAQPRFDAVVSVITDQIDNLRLTMKAPGNDLEIKGKITGLNTFPHGDLSVTSSGMDLDQLIEFPPPAAAAKSGGSNGGTSPGEKTQAKASAEDFDAMLAPIRTNKMLAGTAIAINANIRMLKAKNVKMTDLTGKAYLKDGVAGLDSFAVHLWNGVIKTSAAAQLKPATPQYRFSASVEGLDLSQAVTSQMTFFKDTVVGTANFQMNGEGASFNPQPATKNLKAKGKFSVANAQFTTIDVGKMAIEALNNAISKVGDKIPALKGKGVHSSLPQGGSKYDRISSDFSISNGKFVAPDFVAQAKPNQGIDLKGDTEVGMIDYSLNTTWEVIDTYNLTHAKDISVNPAGVQVDHILAEGNGPVRFPVHVGCTIMQPCYSYGGMAEYLAKVALGNVAGSGKTALKNKALDVLKNQGAPPALGNALQKLFH